MSFFANRSSRHAARLGPVLTAHPARHIGFSRNPNRERTMGNPFKLALCLALAIPFALAACGGGGGTPAKTAMTPTQPEGGMEQPAAPKPEAWPKRTEAELNRVATAESALIKTAESAARIADAEPSFGSVTQSTSGITGATARFDIASQALNISFGAPRTITCDFSCYWNIDGVNAIGNSDTGKRSTNHLRQQVFDIQEDYGFYSTFYGDHNDNYFKGEDATETLEELVNLTTPNDDSDGMGVRVIETVNGDDSHMIRSNIITRWFSDVASVPEKHRNTWATRGYYLGYAGRNLISTAPNIESMVFGAFIDGPEYRNPPRSLPANIKARYMGNASGFVAFRYGAGSPDRADAHYGCCSDWPGAKSRPMGSIVGANWIGDIDLVANFGTASEGSIRGYIGAGTSGITDNNERFIGNGYMRYSEVMGTAGTQLESYRDLIAYTIKLDRATFQRDGTFTGNARIIVHPSEGTRGSPPSPIDPQLNTIRQSRGKWGGKFSNLPLSNNTPSAVGGTIGTTATFRDGTTATFGGTFEASHSGAQHTP